MVRQFWWEQVKEEKKLAWMNWDKMCLSKEKGGMGFKDLKDFQFGFADQTEMETPNKFLVSIPPSL